MVSSKTIKVLPVDGREQRQLEITHNIITECKIKSTCLVVYVNCSITYAEVRCNVAS